VYDLEISSPTNNVSTLSPFSRFKPPVRIERTIGGGFEIIEDKSAVLQKGEEFKEDIAFRYLNHLIGQVLVRFPNERIDADLLKALIVRHLSHIDFASFKINELKKAGDVFYLPYRNAKTRKEYAIKYYLPGEKDLSDLKSDSFIPVLRQKDFYPIGIGDKGIICEFAEIGRIPQGSNGGTDVTREIPELSLTTRDWNMPINILRDYKEAANLPYSLNELVKVKINDECFNELALDAQEGNEASFYVLLMFADKYARQSNGKISAKFGMHKDTLQYDPLETLRFCLARYEPFGNFRSYLYTSIYWKVFSFYLKEAKNGKLVDKDENEKLARGEIRESDIAYRDFMINGGNNARDYRLLPHSLADISFDDFRLFAAIIMGEMELKQAVFAFGKTPTYIRNLLHTIWQRINLDADLRKIFKRLRFDVEAFAAGKMPDVGFEPVVISAVEEKMLIRDEVSRDVTAPENAQRDPGDDDSPAIALEKVGEKWREFALKKWHHGAINRAIEVLRQKAYRLPETDIVVQDFRRLLLGIARKKGYTIDFKIPVLVYSLPDKELYDEIYKNINAVKQLHPSNEKFPERKDFVLVSHPGTYRNKKVNPWNPISYNLFIPAQVLVLLKKAKDRDPAYMDWLRHEAAHVIERAMNNVKDEMAVVGEHSVEAVVNYYNLCRSSEYVITKPDTKEKIEEKETIPLARIKPVKVPRAESKDASADIEEKERLIHGIRRSEIIRMIISVRKEFRDFADSLSISLEMLRQLEFKGIDGEIEHDGTHFWAATTKFVIDPFPEAGGERFISQASNAGDEFFVIAEKGSDFQRRLYTGTVYYRPFELEVRSMIHTARKLSACEEQLENKKKELRDRLKGSGKSEAEIEKEIRDNGFVRHMEARVEELVKELRQESDIVQRARSDEVAGERGAGVLRDRENDEAARKALGEKIRERIKTLTGAGEPGPAGGKDTLDIWTYREFREAKQRIAARLSEDEKRILRDIRDKHGMFDMAAEARLVLLVDEFLMDMSSTARSKILRLMLRSMEPGTLDLKVASVLNACKLLKGSDVFEHYKDVAEAFELGVKYENVEALSAPMLKAQYCRKYVEKTRLSSGPASRADIRERADIEKTQKMGEEFVRACIKMVMEGMIRHDKRMPGQLKNASDMVIIGVDTSWVPPLQKGNVQVLLDKIKASLKKAGMENVIIVREEEEDLADAVLAVIREEKDKHKRDVDMSNVIIAVDQRVLRSGAFAKFKGAFFASIAKPDDFTDTCYTRIVEILTMAIQLAFEGAVSTRDPLVDYIKQDERTYMFIPQAVPMDIGELRKMYENLIKVIADA
jgi:hypothetical protein